MPPLPQLQNPAEYRACDWDLIADAEGRQYWLDHFCNHLTVIIEYAMEEYAPVAPEQLEALRSEYLAMMAALRTTPARYGRLDVLMLDELRNDLLTRHGFEDPFRGVKRREDAAAMAQLPAVLKRIDAMPEIERIHLLIDGLFAGNIFDLGSMPTIERYRARGTSIDKSRTRTPGGFHSVEDVNAFLDTWRRGPGYQHVFFFVDNAGGDICLGCLPLARWMLEHGARVTLAANTRPALNDILAHELKDLVQQAAKIDVAFGDARLQVVATGNGAPLIDLATLNDECVRAAAGADLIILHGMGRSIESNYTAKFTCDSLRTAVVKDEAVAKHVGRRLFDYVFRFERGTAT